MSTQDLLPETEAFWPSIDDYRRSRMVELDSVLTRVVSQNALMELDRKADPDLSYAVRYHLLGMVESLAGHGDLGAVTDSVLPTLSKAVTDAVQVDTQTFAVVVRATDADLMVDAEVSATPFAYLSHAMLDRAHGAGSEAVSQAFELASAAGFEHLLTQNAKVIVLLNQRELGDTVESYTTNRLPATVFTDFYREPWLLARDLIHEGAHTALNDALAAHAERLPDDVTYYSPWKQIDRPVHGFLHAVWAFSHVALYSRWLAESVDVPSDIRLFSTVQSKSYRNELKSIAADLPSALDWLESQTIADAIRNVWRRAVSDAD